MHMSIGHTLQKVGFALWQWPKTLLPVKKPRLVMTLLVKNEADILAANLEFHHAMGVDGFIVTDNNSSDATMDILRQYERRGWVWHIISEPATGYLQKRWVDRMVWMAKRQYGADWVINADADEFWWPPTGNLKAGLDSTRAGVLHCQTVSVLPVEGQPLSAWEETVRAVKPEDEARYGLCPFSHYARQRGKVLHRTDGYLQIAQGNHKVLMLPRVKRESDIIIYHYSLRGKAHFISKMVTGGKAYEANPSKHGGRHWRYFYALHKQGRLEQAYEESVMGCAHMAELRRDGYIVHDNPLPQWFASHLHTHAE